jgi:hypothetical protein
MSLNELLIWMSARAEGSWQQFRSAIESFSVEAGGREDGESSEDASSGDLPLYQSARWGLERVAHVEFTSSGAELRWRVVPPTLAVRQHEGRSIGIVCGARSPGLHRALRQLSGAISVDTQSAPGIPDLIRLVSTDTEGMYSAGRRLGFLVQPNASVALLTAIPPVDDRRSRSPSDPPSGPGWALHRFIARSRGWEEAGPQDLGSPTPGLFRYQLGYQRLYFLRSRGRWYRVPVQVGKYVLLRRGRIKRVVRYERRRAILSVPVAFRPPLLIERSLALCSGLLAQHEQSTGRLKYVQVPPDVARLVAALLCQQLEVL